MIPIPEMYSKCLVRDSKSHSHICVTNKVHMTIHPIHVHYTYISTYVHVLLSELHVAVVTCIHVYRYNRQTSALLPTYVYMGHAGRV